MGEAVRAADDGWVVLVEDSNGRVWLFDLAVEYQLQALKYGRRICVVRGKKGAPLNESGIEQIVAGERVCWFPLSPVFRFRIRYVSETAFE